MIKCRKNYVEVGVGNMKIKTYFVIFSTSRSILELMLCNPNLTKLLYPTLCLDCRAWALKLSEYLKNFNFFQKKESQKRH